VASPAPDQDIQKMKKIEQGRRKHSVLAMIVSIAGVAVCLTALGGFVLTVATNNLPWYPGLTVQDHYVEIGRSYTQGFVVGFFLCFFMTVGAIGVSQWVENRRKSARAGVHQASPGARVA
jgi:hypothetical protein